MENANPQSKAAHSWLRWVLLPIIAYVSLLVSVVAVVGVAISPDGMRERELASLLPQVDWLPWRYLPLAAETVAEAHSELNYLVYEYLLALILVVADDYWLLAHGIVNALLLGGTLALGAFVLLRAGVSRLALGIFWCLAFSGWHLMQWAFVTQSEPLYTLEVAAIVLVAAAALGRNDGHRPWREVAILVALAVLCFFTRPTSPPVVSVALWLAVVSLVVMPGAPESRVGRYRWTLAVLGAGLIGVLLLGTMVLADPTLLPEGSTLRRVYLELYTPHANQGQVVWVRPETFVEPGSGYGQALSVSVWRLPMFFWFRAEGYSQTHNLINSVFYPILYLFTLLGLWAGLSPRSGLPLAARAVVWAGLPLILAIDVFHAFTLLDFNWRYRTPTYPAVYPIAAIGAAWGIEAWRARQGVGKHSSARPK